MDSATIYKAIYQYFVNYEYKLFNTFLYDWESDFFAQSKSGYRVEVEVKVSRSDYFKDFEKPKHKLFQSWLQKKTHHIDHWPCDNHTDSEHRLIGTFLNKKISFRYGEKRGYYGEPGWMTGMKNGKWGYWANYYGPATIKVHEERIYAQATRIKIRLLADIPCPNQFYYACPEGLITDKELPPYAGLIIIKDDSWAKLVKKAPYMHKNHQDLTKRLLKKFYNLWQYKVDRDTKLALSTQKNTQ